MKINNKKLVVQKVGDYRHLSCSNQLGLNLYKIYSYRFAILESKFL